ncbi:MAG: 50S ribosomal protein L30 [Magnetococcales bacterium]|nr:50S ribosomal protein L30 [Magnetococcales bacterium]
MAKKILVKQVRSTTGRPGVQRKIMHSLGLRGIGQKNELPDNPAVRGMVTKIKHLVEVTE